MTQDSISTSYKSEDSKMKDAVSNDSEIETFLGSNLSEMLAQATMEDLRTLADILGVTYQVSSGKLELVGRVGVPLLRPSSRYL